MKLLRIVKMILGKPVTQCQVAEFLWDLFPEGKVYIDPRHIDKSFGEIKIILPSNNYAAYYNFKNNISKGIHRIDCSIVDSSNSLISKIVSIKSIHGDSFNIECFQENNSEAKFIPEVYQSFR